MTLHRALGLLLVVMHGLVGVLGALLLWDARRPWILVLEVVLVFSLLVAFSLLRSLKKPEEMVKIGTEWMKEGDFSHSFLPGGTADLKKLTHLYNEMIAQLREERIRLEEQELFLHKLINASPSGIIITDYDGKIRVVNPKAEKILGSASDTWCGHKPEDLPGSLIAQLADIPRDRSRLLNHGGGRKLKCFHSQFFDRGFPRSFFVLEDLTHELWSTEKKAYRTLIRTLSHEVNNTIGATNSILHSALAYGQQLTKDDRQEFTAALNVAIKRTDHLNAFMRRYADVVRVPKPVLETVDFPALIRRVSALLNPECAKRNIDLHVKLADSFPALAMDPILMEQVLVNVVRNAIEAVERNGRVTILTGIESGVPFVLVEDDGPGLTQEARQNLFTPFYSTKTDGQGIGLTLVKEILTLHEFDYSLESRSGEPTRFKIQFQDGQD